VLSCGAVSLVYIDSSKFKGIILGSSSQDQVGEYETIQVHHTGVFYMGLSFIVDRVLVLYMGLSFIVDRVLVLYMGLSFIVVGSVLYMGLSFIVDRVCFIHGS
jgi:hypothetical protein